MSTLRREYRNYPTIGAVILIAIGAIWLLFESQILTNANLIVLLRLWPLVLVALGLELLIGRRSRTTALAIGAGAVVLLLALMVAGSALGLVPSVQIKQGNYNAALDSSTTSAQINLNFSVGRNTVQAASDPSQLITADLHYIGDIDFNVEGAAQKVVTLSNRNNNVQTDFLGISLLSQDDRNKLRWDVGLTPNIPLDLRLNGGVGDNTIDLSSVQLSHFTFSPGVGISTITMPGTGRYDMSIKGGVGDSTVNLTDGATVNLTINAGVGTTTLALPGDLPVHLQATGGVGRVIVPSSLSHVSGSGAANGTTVWESSNYQSSEAHVTIDYIGGVGNLIVTNR